MFEAVGKMAGTESFEMTGEGGVLRSTQQDLAVMAKLGKRQQLRV